LDKGIIWQKEEGRRQKAEGRRQKAEGRKQKAESRKQKAESRKQKAEGRNDLRSVVGRFSVFYLTKHRGIEGKITLLSAFSKSSSILRKPFLPSAFCLLPL
jgi:hypothetical protein